MAKAAPIPEMPAETPLGEYAACVIEVRAGEVQELCGDPPGRDAAQLVHDRRVAIRRLRTAIEVFAPSLPRKVAGSLRRDLRDQFAMLGPRRDADVALETLAGLESRLAAADRPGYRGLVDTIDDEGSGTVDLEALTTAAQDALVVAERARTRGGPAAGEALREAATLRTAEVRARLDTLTDPRDAEAIHDLRKYVKRLRYVLEAGGPVLGPAAAKGADAARELQDLLGSLHDSEVLLRRIRARRRGLRAADVAAARAGEPLSGATHHRGIAVLDAMVRAHRADLRAEATARRKEADARLESAAEQLLEMIP